MKYRFVDHTADIAFEIFGESLAELLENATYAFYEAFVELRNLSALEERRISVEADDFESLLYKWLNELLYLFDTQFFAAKHVKVLVKGTKAEGTLSGGKYSPEDVKVEPKAITLHKFRVEKENKKFRAFVVIDI